MHQTLPGESPRVGPRTVDHAPIAATEEGATRAFRRSDIVWIVILAAWVLATRLPFISDFSYLSKDGPLYVHSLALDRSYSVPMPGNLGFVLLGKVAQAAWPDPLHAYAAVGIGLTIVAAAFSYLFAALVVPRPLAAASAFALSANAMVWWYGEVIASYLVWLAVLPALGWFCVRYTRHRRFGDLVGASVVLALGMILRPDLLFFGTPLWLGSLGLGRASWKRWLVGGAILAAGCACWFFGTAAVLGGVGVYLDRVHAKHVGDLEGFSFARRGIVEGLLRNGTKYALFLAWGSPLVLAPFLWGAARARFALRENWRGIVLALLWVGPSWYFSSFVFAGNAGLIFPFLPLAYVGAARGFEALLGRRGEWAPAAAMTLLGLLSTMQFLGTPLLRETDQRRVILNVTFLRYSAAGLVARYNYNLDDYGVSPSLTAVLRQMRDPEPIPTFPPPNPPEDGEGRTRARVSSR